MARPAPYAGFWATAKLRHAASSVASIPSGMNAPCVLAWLAFRAREGPCDARGTRRAAPVADDHALPGAGCGRRPRIDGLRRVLPDQGRDVPDLLGGDRALVA